MKIGAIVCEYNPLHNGHIYLIDKARAKYGIDTVIGIMSGSFVQRGEPAVINKFERAKDAVLNGVDLIIELPVYFSIQSAEFFASGAVKILEKCNIINYQIFGSESGSIDRLNSLLDIIESDRYKELFLNLLENGNSYTYASRTALEELLIDSKKPIENIKSNDILGIEYLKSLKNTNIVPLAVKRKGSDHLSLSTHDSFISATSIRNLLNKDDDISKIKNQLPQTTFKTLQNMNRMRFSSSLQNLFNILKFLYFVEKKDMTNIMRYENGMENLIDNGIRNSNSWDDLISYCTSKRYSSSRIRRFIISYILGINNKMNINDADLYIRPLAFNDRGADALRLIKDNSDIPIISKFSEFYYENANKLLDVEIKATNLYNQIMCSEVINEDFIFSPQKIKTANRID